MKRAVLLMIAVALPVVALAQGPGLGLGPGLGQGLESAVGGVLGRVSNVTGDVLHTTTTTLGQTVESLATLRIDRLATFVQTHRATVERDDTGAPARAHEVLLLDPDPAALRIATDAGFALIEQGDLDGLGLGYARLRTPAGKGLSSALHTLRKVLPGRTVTADQIHFASGNVVPSGGAAPSHAAPGSTRVGIIDGGVRPGARIADQAGFAKGAPHPDAHAQAIASLLAGAGTGRIYVADVYGTDPAGGDALAIARALGWMQNHGVRVVSISLVGPANPLLARAVATVQARGLVVVAAVGNDGSAAPAAYPASYPGVVAVTGVDAHNHVLFEAGHALHLDYAAPGADLTAVGLAGRVEKLRGTSLPRRSRHRASRPCAMGMIPARCSMPPTMKRSRQVRAPAAACCATPAAKAPEIICERGGLNRRGHPSPSPEAGFELRRHETETNDDQGSHHDDRAGTGAAGFRPRTCAAYRWRLGGGFGGGLGGLGGGFGGGLSTGVVGGSLGAAGNVTNNSVNGTAHATTHVKTPKAPKVTAPTKLVENADGKVTSTSTGATNRVGATATDAAGHLAATTTEVNGRVVSTATDAKGRLVTTMKDAKGQLTAVTTDVKGRVIDTKTFVRPTLERTGSVLEGNVTRIAAVPAIPDYFERRVAIYDAGIAPIGYDDAGAYVDTQYQVLQNDLRGTGVEVIRHGQQIVLEMPSDVTFAFNKHDIQPRFQPVLDAVAHTLTKYPATYIDVDGHTDAVGSQAFNQVLSEKRADTVASYLAERSVVSARMHVEGFGKTEPVASNSTIMGRAANRRVEIVLTPYTS